VFTGIVREVGEVREVRLGARSAMLEVAAPGVAATAAPGDSVLTDGVCLTVTAVEGGRFRADATPETVRRTTLGERRPGDRVNLEPAQALGDRLGGHLVTGHVDGVGVVRAVRREENALVVDLAVPGEVAALTVPRGSLAVDGVSLTVVAVTGGTVRVSLIPHTAAVTTLGGLRPGRRVNLEADVLARYVAGLLARGRAAEGLTWETLREAGF
jgi:riboflavin synthase